MRKIILLTMIAFCTLSFGQSLIITPTGLKDSNDTGKSYVVINAEGKTAKELYENAIKHINKNYKSPNEVIKGKSEGEFLKYITHAPAIANARTWSSRKVPFDLDYTIELNFKDNKVKYEIISLDMTWRNLSGGILELLFVEDIGLVTVKAGIYKKNGDLKNDEAKEQIETYFNSQIKSLSLALNGEDNNESW